MSDRPDSPKIDKPKLSDWISKYFSPDEIQELCQELNIPFDEIKRASHKTTVIELVEYCERHGRMPDLVKYGKEHRPNVPSPDNVPLKPPTTEAPPLELPKEKKLHLPFTNREDEIRLVMATNAPAYYLLDAPAGYGKTELLYELKRRFTDEGWDSAYVLIEEPDSISEVTNRIYRELDLPTPIRNIPNLPAGTALGSAILERWNYAHQRQNSKVGVVLLLDLDKRPSLPFVETLLNEFIPRVHKTLQGSTFFTQTHNRFRVIITGRYLAARNVVRTAKVPLTIRQLSPFDYKVIRDSTGKHLDNFVETTMEQLSAHLVYLTGGHPGCIAQILHSYRHVLADPDLFLDLAQQETWTTIIRDYVNEVKDGIDRQNGSLFHVLDRLTVFRHIDHAILKKVFQADAAVQPNDPYDLADTLTATYLLAWNGRFLQDGITRRLLAIRLRQEMPAEFQTRCREAMQLCAERIEERNVQRPEIWIIEYLFLALQQHAHLLHSLQERQRIEQYFLEVPLREAIELFLVKREVPPEDWRFEINTLSQTMEGDWEFRFTVNYYLRAESYDEKPFGRLQQQLQAYYRELQKNRR
jgi:hypothetical protein